MLIIKKEELLELLKKEIEFTEHLKYISGIEEMMVNQAIKESSLFIYATRYEKHINDMSVGLYQLLIGTMKWLGYKGEIKDSFDINTQVRFALQYLDYLYSRFPEIKIHKERIAITISAYNCGIGNINKALKQGRKEEEIYYEGADTIQGKWSTYEGVCKMFHKYNIIADKNIDINKRYVEFIVGKLL